MAAEHGYTRYTRGCRCDECRAAKRAYMRAKRREAAGNRLWAVLCGQRYVATGILHGGISGYQDHHCRCDACRLAKAEVSERETRRKVSV